MPVDPKNWPTSKIGSDEKYMNSPALEGNPYGKRSAPNMVKVTRRGEIAVVSMENARDMTRLDGWSMVGEEAPEVEVSEKEGEEAQEVASSVEAEAEKAPTLVVEKPANELEELRKEFFELTGKEPRSIWGKKALSDNIAQAKARNEQAENEAED